MVGLSEGAGLSWQLRQKGGGRELGCRREVPVLASLPSAEHGGFPDCQGYAGLLLA